MELTRTSGFSRSKDPGGVGRHGRLRISTFRSGSGAYMWPLGLVGVLGLRLQCHTTRPQAVTCHQDDSDDESEAAAKRRRKRFVCRICWALGQLLIKSPLLHAAVELLSVFRINGHAGLLGSCWFQAVSTYVPNGSFMKAGDKAAAMSHSKSISIIEPSRVDSIYGG